MNVQQCVYAYKMYVANSDTDQIAYRFSSLLLSLYNIFIKIAY